MGQVLLEYICIYSSVVHVMTQISHFSSLFELPQNVFLFRKGDIIWPSPGCGMHIHLKFAIALFSLVPDN